jgi:hypothetical protein
MAGATGKHESVVLAAFTGFQQITIPEGHLVAAIPRSGSWRTLKGIVGAEQSQLVQANMAWPYDFQPQKMQAAEAARPFGAPPAKAHSRCPIAAIAKALDVTISELVD